MLRWRGFLWSPQAIFRLSRARPASALDAAAPEEGAYISEDYKTATIVQRCAKSPTDTHSKSAFWFPTPKDDGFNTFASVELTVMKNGDISVASGKVEDWMVDANGDWIAD